MFSNYGVGFSVDQISRKKSEITVLVGDSEYILEGNRLKRMPLGNVFVDKDVVLNPTTEVFKYDGAQGGPSRVDNLYVDSVGSISRKNKEGSVFIGENILHGLVKCIFEQTDSGIIVAKQNDNESVFPNKISKPLSNIELYKLDGLSDSECQRMLPIIKEGWEL